MTGFAQTITPILSESDHWQKMHSAGGCMHQEVVRTSGAHCLTRSHLPVTLVSTMRLPILLLAATHTCWKTVPGKAMVEANCGRDRGWTGGIETFMGGEGLMAEWKKERQDQWHSQVTLS